LLNTDIFQNEEDCISKVQRSKRCQKGDCLY